MKLRLACLQLIAALGLSANVGCAWNGEWVDEPALSSVASAYATGTRSRFTVDGYEVGDSVVSADPSIVGIQSLAGEEGQFELIALAPGTATLRLNRNGRVVDSERVRVADVHHAALTPTLPSLVFRSSTYPQLWSGIAGVVTGLNVKAELAPCAADGTPLRYGGTTAAFVVDYADNFQSCTGQVYPGFAATMDEAIQVEGCFIFNGTTPAAIQSSFNGVALPAITVVPYESSAISSLELWVESGDGKTQGEDMVAVLFGKNAASERIYGITGNWSLRGQATDEDMAYGFTFDPSASHELSVRFGGLSASRNVQGDFNSLQSAVADGCSASPGLSAGNRALGPLLVLLISLLTLFAGHRLSRLLTQALD